MDLTDLSLIEASGLLRRREITSDELVRACLERIEALDPLLNSFITITADLALEQAREADRARTAGELTGPLHGIPLALKDLFETRGILTTAGSKFLAGYLPAADCAVYRKLQSAGAVLLGKLNMHEWAFGVTSQNPHYGPVRNPWDPSRIAGGSSGGSAAAVAAGLCLGSLGTDTGGSIRIPASCCGVVGFKPTIGRVSTQGVIPLSPSLDHVGPIGRCVEDVAILYAVISESASQRSSEQANLGSLDLESFNLDSLNLDSGFSIALASDPYFDECDEAVLEAVRAAASAFEALGARVESVPFPGAADAREANIDLLSAEAAAYHAARLSSSPQDFGADVLQRLRRGQNISLDRLEEVREIRLSLQTQSSRFFEDYDLLLTPTLPTVASLIEEADPLRAAPEYTRFTAPFNLTGLPALTLPCGFSQDGLPIGLQLVGPAGSEWSLLQAGLAYEREAGWVHRHPDEL